MIDAIVDTAKRILIATDFDGTLCPIADTPSEVRVPAATFDVLCRAAMCPRLTLSLISGRALPDIQSRLPLDIIFAGNHGLEITGCGLSFEHAGARQLRPALAAACSALTRLLHEWPEAWVEDKGLSATLHFRKVDQSHHGSMLLAAKQSLNGLGEHLVLRPGKRALEVRPRVSWDKGSALRYIQREAGPFDACVCLGDDLTDESMFRANRGQPNIRVGCAARTIAEHHLANPAEVTMLLSRIVDACKSEPFRGGAHAQATFPLADNQQR